MTPQKSVESDSSLWNQMPSYCTICGRSLFFTTGPIKLSIPDISITIFKWSYLAGVGGSLTIDFPSSQFLLKETIGESYDVFGLDSKNFVAEFDQNLH